MADTGIIRWPINFPPSSKAAILREASVGRITCQEVTPWAHFLLNDCFLFSFLYRTFLKTMGSSSHTGLMALLFCEVLVFNAFLLVSAGSPNISTSTYTPTRRSVRNCPEITCERHRVVKTDRYRAKNGYFLPRSEKECENMQTNKIEATVPSQRGCWRRCHPPCFLWRGRSVCPVVSWTPASVCSRCVRCTRTWRDSAAWTNLEHKTLKIYFFGLSKLRWGGGVLEGQWRTVDTQLRTLTYGLVVERHQLAASVPEKLRHEVGRVDSGAFGIDAAQLGFVISG